VLNGKNESASIASAVGDKILRFMMRLGPVPTLKPRHWRGLIAELDRISVIRLAFVAVLSAACGTGVLYLLNTESRLVQEEDYSTLTAVGFIFLLVAYRFSQRHLIFRASESIEAALHDWRQRIAGKVLSLSLRDIEEISPGRLLDGIARHYAPLSQSVVTIVAGVEAMVLLIFMFGYLLYLSTTAALLTVLVAVLCVAGYMNIAARLAETMTETAILNGRLDRLSESSIKGSKELRLNAKKRRAVLEDMVTTSDELFKNRSASAGIFAEVISSGNTASYLMAGAVVFVLPIIGSTEQDQISVIVMAVIFLIGPIGGMIGSLQQLSIARFAVRSILEFEAGVDHLLASSSNDSPEVDHSAFKRIELRKVGYTHQTALDVDKPFAIEEVSVCIERGQLLFITGGNGSGKTTALRVLTGLYPRDSGDIIIDGDVIGKNPGQNYRDLFATVFADFHVFGRAYALDDEALIKLDQWLIKLNIRSKMPADLSHGFSPDALSTGQRKRLALALALVENRPVLVLDEWAADQDPSTRNRFYEEILPELLQAGKTIIVVTHDERYFDYADIHAHMQDGRLVPAECPASEVTQ
jgi:putative ATP-binding cassette transporter